MAETKLTKEQIAKKHVVSGQYDMIRGITAQAQCVAAINEYAAQQQAEHERVLAVLREHEGDISCCVGMYEVGRHSKDCWLAALLAADKEANPSEALS